MAAEKVFQRAPLMSLDQALEFLLKEAKAAELHSPKDYKKSPQEYCGMKISDNPYYDA
jgi:hypothetical protein